MKYKNTVEFKVYGPLALFSDPITRIGGEKCSYQIPTYEAMKGVLHSIYWKPTLIWIVDEVRVMKRIRMQTKGVRTIKYEHGQKDASNDLSYYTYLTDVEYRVRAHFEWNLCREELAADRNENKHYEIAKRSIAAGGRRDVYLGTRECQAYVEPCAFDEGAGEYDDTTLSFGLMFHGFTYPDESQTKGDTRLVKRFFNAKMVNGVVKYPRPEECTVTSVVREGLAVKRFGITEDK